MPKTQHGKARLFVTGLIAHIDFRPFSTASVSPKATKSLIGC